LLDSTVDDWAPTLSDDGLTLVFDSGRGASEDLYISLRATTADAFGAPTSIASLNSGTLNESNATFSGSFLYFSTFNPTTMTIDFHVAPYLGNGVFGASQSVTPGVPGFAVALSADGLELFYTANPSQNVDVLRHATRSATDMAWTTDSSLDSFTPGGTVGGWPSFDEARQTLYFERTVGAGLAELVSTTRANASAAFGAATVVSMIGVQNGDPEISSDGTTLLFASDRAGGDGLFDLYMAMRTCQ
jgi:hypothetical protein